MATKVLCSPPSFYGFTELFVWSCHMNFTNRFVYLDITRYTISNSPTNPSTNTNRRTFRTMSRYYYRRVKWLESLRLQSAPSLRDVAIFLVASGVSFSSRIHTSNLGYIQVINHKNSIHIKLGTKVIHWTDLYINALRQMFSEFHLRAHFPMDHPNQAFQQHLPRKTNRNFKEKCS